MNTDVALTKGTPGGFAVEVPVHSVQSVLPERFHREYLLPRIPLVITGASSDWPALTKWTWEWLGSFFGDVIVDLTDVLGEKQQAKLSEYIEYVLDPSRHTVQNGPLYLRDLHISGELCKDYCIPNFIDDWFASFPTESRPPFRWFFIGPASTGSRLHVDTSGTHAWLTQIHGEKEWILFPPGDLPDAYCGAADAFFPDFDAFEVFGRARCFRAILKPGETIFVPCGWVHQVRNLGPSWALTENFFNASNIADVFRLTAKAEIRRDIDIISLQKAAELAAVSDETALVQHTLLQSFFQSRVKDLEEQLNAMKKASSLLDHKIA